jgi:uncharacterized membrane protein YeiH
MTLPSFPHLDLFAAGINALYAALTARSPKHNRDYTLVGIMILAVIGGIGGGLTRDVLLDDLPGPFVHASYLVACFLMGALGIALDAYSASRGERFRTKTLSYVKSFTLPWFAILGAHKALDHELGILAAIVVGVIATTAGGVLIDLISGVTPPDIVRRSEHLVTTAILAAAVYAVLAVTLAGTLAVFPITLIAVVVAFAFRLIAVTKHWEEIVPGRSS